MEYPRENKKITLFFDEVPHKYYNKDTMDEFTSATTLIGMYKDSFNTEYWAMYPGLKNANISVRHEKQELKIKVNGVFININTLYQNDLYKRMATKVKADWKAKTDRANKRGNKIHDYLEDSINASRGDESGSDNKFISPLKERDEDGVIKISNKNDLDKTDLLDNYPSIYTRLLGYIERGCYILAEKRIYSSKFLIAGMIDVLIVKGKQFAILDWKTNKDVMMFESGYFKKKKVGQKFVKSGEFVKTDDRLQYPLNNIPNCKGMVYSLQLSLYAFIMEMWGYKLVKNGLEICHIRRNSKPKILKIKYYKDDIYNMLKHSMVKRNVVKEEKKLENNNNNNKNMFKL